LPDFRAGERTFQILVQVAGRCGRGDIPGEVIVQTYSPSNYAVIHASRHDYRGFYEAELSSRRELEYPPFSHIISVIATSHDESRAVAALGEIASRLSGGGISPPIMADGLPRADAGQAAGGSMKLLGPSPLAMRRAKGEYRWHILIKARDIGLAAHLVREAALEVSKEAMRTGVRIMVDIDPQDMV
ncbi:MAG TPA: primosomal protein N', partial [Firmicutes bacterium]|nr:primosomal protein N' [Bacillota bacterium]